MDGYSKPYRLDIKVEAQMAESWSGYTEAQAEKELIFAVGSVDIGDVQTLQWLAAGIERRLIDLSVQGDGELYDVVGRSGNIATGILLAPAQELARVSGCEIRPHVRGSRD